MAGKHEHIRRDRRFDVGQRAQINAECVEVRLHRVNTDIGGDFRDDLIGREEQLLCRPVEHCLLQRMAAAGQHLEVAPANRQRVAMLDAMIGGRHTGREAQIFVARGSARSRSLRPRDHGFDRRAGTRPPRDRPVHIAAAGCAGIRAAAWPGPDQNVWSASRRDRHGPDGNALRSATPGPGPAADRRSRSPTHPCCHRSPGRYRPRSSAAPFSIR